MSRKAEMLLEKLAESYQGVKMPSNVVVEEAPVSRAVSIPSRYLQKLILWDSSLSKGTPKDLSPYTLKFVAARAKEHPELEFRVGNSPVFSQMARAATGKSTTFHHPLLRPISVPVAGLTGLAGKLSGIDYYNPMSNTVVVKSDNPAMVAAKVGEHKDVSGWRFPTVYDTVTGLPILRTIKSYRGMHNAGDYLTPEQSKVLTPMFSIGAAADIMPGLTLPVLLASHAVKGNVNFGRRKQKEEFNGTKTKTRRN